MWNEINAAFFFYHRRLGIDEATAFSRFLFILVNFKKYFTKTNRNAIIQTETKKNKNKQRKKEGGTDDGQ